MCVMESKIIQPFLKSMCPAPRSCHPSQCSATCNLFCLCLSHYVNARINCIVRFSRGPATTASAPSIAEGLVPDSASVFKGIGHWAGLILFLESFLLSFPAASHWELLQGCRAGCGRAGCCRGGRHSRPATRGHELPPPSSGPWGHAAIVTTLWELRSLSLRLTFRMWGASGRWGASQVWHFPCEFPWEQLRRELGLATAHPASTGATSESFPRSSVCPSAAPGSPRHPQLQLSHGPGTDSVLATDTYRYIYKTAYFPVILRLIYLLKLPSIRSCNICL